LDKTHLSKSKIFIFMWIKVVNHFHFWDQLLHLIFCGIENLARHERNFPWKPQKPIFTERFKNSDQMQVKKVFFLTCIPIFSYSCLRPLIFASSFSFSSSTSFNFSAKDSVVSSGAPEETEMISVVVDGASVVLGHF